MGTWSAQKVYRHKGHYFVEINDDDEGYPSNFGLDVLSEIPRGVPKEKFEGWVKSTREHYDRQYEKGFVEEQPENDLMIQWTYEIDLDNLVFHIDSQPLFRLDNMPPNNVFLRGISFDHFGNRALYEHTPIQYRYNWQAPPPTPTPSSLISYNSYLNQSSTSSVRVHELLRMPMELSSIERTRTTLMGLLVTRCMADGRIGYGVHFLEKVPNCNDIPQGLREVALSFVNFAVGPPIPSLPCSPPSDIWDDFIWVRKDVCLRITTHLDDDENLKASIGELIHHIHKTPDQEGTIYGIAFSTFHCAIVRVDKDGKDTSFSHTPALQFLPSFYARKISTPGIEALSRLGCQAGGAEFLSAISEAYNLPHITHKTLLVAGSMVARVPVEVWANIGQFLTSPKDLITLASISRQAMSAAADLARHPWVRDFRLVDVVGSITPIPETTEKTSEEAIRQYYRQLGRAKFTAAKGGRRVTVELGQLEVSDKMSASAGLRIPFKVETYMGLRAGKGLYVSELDEAI